MRRDTRGRFTAERTTTTTTTTERVTLEPIPWAPGYPHQLPSDASIWRQQRWEQVWRVRDLLGAMADDGHTFQDPATLRQSVTMLRALPGATCMELEHGRSV